MSERYLVTVDGHEITRGSVSWGAALGIALEILDGAQPAASEIAIAESRTLQVVAWWRHGERGWRLIGAAQGWLTEANGKECDA